SSGNPVGPIQREAGGDQKAPAQDGGATSRRVIHTATLELLVDDIEPARQALLRLVEEYKGFVAGSETGGSPGVPRSGHWTVRVPVAKYSEFVDAAGRLGETLHVRTDAQDVTEQFVDLEARLKNKRVEEERLQEHLKSSTGKLEDILAVEKELSRVRGEIEEAEGRRQKLTNLADLATVTVSLRERKGYTPPESPAFGATVGRTFGESLDLLGRCGKGLVLVAVAVAPWLPVLVVIVGAAWLIGRRRRVAVVPPAARTD
ncbi:MAG TPA: DUF4349 domain-containing protein, partial [Gemmataceae bacterium]